MSKLSFADELSNKQISKEDFDMLLGWLNPDRNKAGEKYENIRKSVTEYFRRRGALDPLSLTDQVIDRVAVKVRALQHTYVGDPANYFLGVARRVIAEMWRQPVQVKLPDTIPAAFADEIDESRELLFQKLEQCLRNLPQQYQEVLLRYYGEISGTHLRERRERLAREVGLTPNALRVTTHRLREKLKRCIERQLKKQS